VFCINISSPGGFSIATRHLRLLIDYVIVLCVSGTCWQAAVLYGFMVLTSQDQAPEIPSVVCRKAVACSSKSLPLFVVDSSTIQFWGSQSFEERTVLERLRLHDNGNPTTSCTYVPYEGTSSVIVAHKRRTSSLCVGRHRLLLLQVRCNPFMLGPTPSSLLLGNHCLRAFHSRGSTIA
jgi:hypothetical protein